MKADPVVDIAYLYEWLDHERKRKGISWRDAASDIGVSASTLTRVSQGASPDLEGFGKMVCWLGLSADEFITRKPQQAVRKPDGFLVAVTRYLRASDEFGPKSSKAMLGIIEAAYRDLRFFKSH